MGTSIGKAGLTEEQKKLLKHLTYNPTQDRIEANRAIETTLNSLYLGEQHKMSSGAENIFFTNLGSEINFFPMWGGLKDQRITANQGASGYIPPSGRVYTDMQIAIPNGASVAGTSAPYSSNTLYTVSIAGLGVKVVLAEPIVASEICLRYLLTVSGKQVYAQEFKFSSDKAIGDTVEWWFDHPVEIHAGTNILAEVRKVNMSNDADEGILNVTRGDAPGNPRHIEVYSRLFEDKDLELISPYTKYTAMDFGLDSTGSTVILRDLSLGSENVLRPYAINTIEAVANGANIKIKVKGGSKVIVENLLVTGSTIDGSAVNSVLASALVQLNDLFTNTAGFSSGGNPVTNFALSNNNLTLTLQDGTTHTVDVTTLGVDENKFVSSGSLNGTDLELTMNDSSVITIDISNMANGFDTNYAPSISNQTKSISEGQAFNVQIDLDENSNIVTQYVESDAPSWAVLNQTTGAITGTAPAYNGSSDSYVINCKAANAVGGSVSFQVTLDVQEVTYTNTKSLKFADGTNSYLGGNAALVTALERTNNGSGSSEAWSIGFWMKRGTSSSGQTLFYFGHNDTANNGHIEIRLVSTDRIRLRYGSTNNYIQEQTVAGTINTGWNHVLVTYDGGTTGSSQGDLSNYYGRFKIIVNGSVASVTNAHNNYGFGNSITGQNFRVGKYVSGNYPKNVLINQLCIWNSDQSSNAAGIYNSGNTQNMTDASTMAGSVNTNYLPPDHYYEIESSTTTVTDINGTAHLVGYNFASSDLVTDAP